MDIFRGCFSLVIILIALHEDISVSFVLDDPLSFLSSIEMVPGCWYTSGGVNIRRTRATVSHNT